MASRDQPIVVLPRTEGDRPPWAKVSLIAAAGFIIGIAWPRLAGMRIAPNPPSDGPQAAAQNHAAAALASGSASALARAAAAPSAAALAAPAAVSISVGQGLILSCWELADAKQKECGSLQFDPIAVPKIKGLAQCAAAAGVTGKLSIGFDIDFRKKTIHPKVGKSTTVARDSAEALVKCAEPMFENVGLWEVPHEHRHYTVFYTAELSPPGKQGDTASTPPAVEGRAAGTTTGETAASGTATIGWDVALVRDTPKTGSVVGRILQGSKVKLVGKQGEWYHVQYGSIDGWVHRGAIGSSTTL
jgi:hypothetical protein